MWKYISINIAFFLSIAFACGNTNNSAYYSMQKVAFADLLAADYVFACKIIIKIAAITKATTNNWSE